MSAPHYVILSVSVEKIRESRQGFEDHVAASLPKTLDRAPKVLHIRGVNLVAPVGDVVFVFVTMRAGRIDDAHRVGWDDMGCAPKDLTDRLGVPLFGFAREVRRQPFTFPALLTVHDDGGA